MKECMGSGSREQLPLYWNKGKSSSPGVLGFLQVKTALVNNLEGYCSRDQHTLIVISTEQVFSSKVGTDDFFVYLRI
jgi:hypothetical protein